MYVNRLLLQLAIVTATYVQMCHLVSLPPRFLNDHVYDVVREMCKIHHHQDDIHFDQIYFVKNAAWYCLFSQGINVPESRKYFLPWEVKFLRMTSGKSTFTISGLEGKPKLLVTCQFSSMQQFQDFHREIYVDRVSAYSSDAIDAHERYETWQIAVPGLRSSTRRLRVPDSLRMINDLVGLTKIKKHNWHIDGNEVKRPEILGRLDDYVQIYYEEHKGPIEGKPAETFTVFTVPWSDEENQYVPRVQIVFGTDNFKLVNCYPDWKIVILVESDYYVLSFPTTARVSKAHKHLQEIARSEIPMPPEVEFFIKDLE